ncbi:MAG: hypothetical protein ACTHJ4_02905, partial [Candidatus Nucleicultricaceae bacterium]
IGVRIDRLIEMNKRIGAFLNQSRGIYQSKKPLASETKENINPPQAQKQIQKQKLSKTPECQTSSLSRGLVRTTSMLDIRDSLNI